MADIKTSNGVMRTVSTSNEIAPDDEYSMPAFEIDTKSIPESESWDVGKEYRLEILVKQKRISSIGKGKQVKFCILKIKALS